MNIVTRFAPSPTGNLHCGAYRTAIFSYLYARKHGGKFILRIEDTDKERSKKEYEENILESLAWLGLDYDTFYRQSEHVGRHKELLQKLITDGHAYISKEEAKDGSGIIKEIVRFKNPNIPVTFEDEIKGTVTMDTTDLGDFVIAKNIEEPLFNFAVVVDDWDAGVTHVIRGEDHVSNTPRQILIQRALGAPTPVYAHLPLVLGVDKQKLSKRKGALAVTEYKALGYLPEALLNMVAMVGWNPGTEEEFFSKEALITAFSLSHVQKSPAVFNEEKLNWFNKEYIKKLDSETFFMYATSFVTDSTRIEKLEEVLRDRIVRFSDIPEVLAESDYFFTTPKVNPSLLIWKEATPEETTLHLTKVYTLLESLTEWKKEGIKEALWSYAETEGKGNVFWPLRVALSGKEKSPDPFQIAEIIGKDETLARIQNVM